MLSESLKGVVCQQLLKTADGKGRVAALEIMLGTRAIGNLIREGKTFQIPSIIQTAKKDGMQLMDSAPAGPSQDEEGRSEEAYRCARTRSSSSKYLPEKPAQ